MKLVIGITLAVAVLIAIFFISCCMVAGHEDELFEQYDMEEQDHGK